MANKIELPTFSLFVRPPDTMINPSLSIFEKDTPAILQYNDKSYEVFVKYRGNHTRKLIKKSYDIRLKSPELLGNREVHLNAEYFDTSFIRNKLSLDLFQSFGVLSPSSQHIRLNINDQYEGVYLQLESVSDLFLKHRQLPLGPIYYAVNNNGNFSLINPFTKKMKDSLMLGYQRKLGTSSDDYYLTELISIINHTPFPKFEEEISKYLSVEKYLRWLAVAVCTQNLDGFKKNYALYRNTQNGLFEIIPWDYDATFGRDWNGEDLHYKRIPISGYNNLSQKLLEIPTFRQQYKGIMEEILETLFTSSNLEPKINALTQFVRPHLTEDVSLEVFDLEPTYMLRFIEKRNQYLSYHLKDLQ